MTASRAEVRELELAAGISPLVLDAPASFVQLLVRLHGHPIGWVQLPTRGEAELDAQRLRHAISAALGWQIAPDLLAGQRPPLRSPAHGPAISVIVCTRDRPGELEGCLEAIHALDYPSFEVVVVDNASTGTETELLTSRFGSRYVSEPRPGLDWARNRGIAEARHGIVAFTDDDARVDALWLAALAQALADPTVSAATGLVAPLELETDAQILFEFDYGGMGKGFQPWHAEQRSMGPERLLRTQNLGVGANMCFRREVFDQVGGFDPALDVGTPARGGGDLDMFHRVVTAGLTLQYEPSALVWHRHRRSLQALERQLGDDGRAFTIYLMKVFRTGTVPRRAVVRFAWRHWIRWLLCRLVRKLAGREPLPFRMLWAPIRGVLRAPTAARKARRLAAPQDL